MVLVIEDDKHFSLERIAGNSIINVFDAESVEQLRLNVAHLQRAVESFNDDLWLHHRL